MTVGLLIALACVGLYCVYVVGFSIGVQHTDYIWRSWLEARIKVQTKTRVEDLYPEKTHE